MKEETSQWVRRYQRALRKHVKQGPGETLRPALALGRKAVALGMETLDVANIHKRAQAALELEYSESKVVQKKMIQRAREFFAEAVVPIEKTHRSARKADHRVAQLTETLRKRTAESSASTRNLAHGILQRRKAEESLKKNAARQNTLLAESRRLQKELSQLTRKTLSAQEVERQRASHQLQDEIAQLLLAINVRLLALKQAANANTESLKKEIAETQRLVRKSKRLAERMAREYEVRDRE